MNINLKINWNKKKDARIGQIQKQAIRHIKGNNVSLKGQNIHILPTRISPIKRKKLHQYQPIKPIVINERSHHIQRLLWRIAITSNRSFVKKHKIEL